MRVFKNTTIVFRKHFSSAMFIAGMLRTKTVYCTYILHLNNAIDKINKRCRCFHEIREAKISEDKNPRLTIDCCFDILAV